MPIRVRFAPSPTGQLHVGALRDALFKHLFARHEGGVNILRIEDTDRSRYNPDSEEEFVTTLRWVGIEFDEGPHIGGPHAPYRQSERKEAGIYARWIEELLQKGNAYKAFETPQELEAMREYQQINKQPTGYFGGEWREAPPEKVAQAEGEGKPYVIRQRIPRGQRIAIDDAIRGRIEWDSDTVDDPVLIKADGMPTYHFAAMVDDHLMEITHIMRGEEWISSAPKHAALFDAFGWERPIFVHCPVIVGNDGKKLSKRHGTTRVLDYASEGFLPHPLKNFVALIGWSPGDEREIMTEEELVEAFTLDGLQPSPGRFDLDKLRWMNGASIRSMDPSQLLDVVLEYIRRPETLALFEKTPEEGEPDRRHVAEALRRLERAATEDRNYALEAIKLEQERVQILSEFGEACAFLFEEEPPIDPKAVAKWFAQPHAGELFDFLIGRLDEAPQADPADAGDQAGDATGLYEALLRDFAENKGFEKLGPVVHPTRVALTGKTVGPGLFELMAALGPERIVRRLRRAKGLLSSGSAPA